MEQHKAQVTAAWNRAIRRAPSSGRWRTWATSSPPATARLRAGRSLRQHEQPAQADRRQESPHQTRPRIPRQGLSEGLPADRGRGAGAGRRAPRRDGAVPQERGTGAREATRSSAARSCSANSSRAAMPWSRRRRRWPTGSGRPGTNSRSGRSRSGWRSGRAICRRAGASGSTAPRTGRRDLPPSSAASPASS